MFKKNFKKLIPLLGSFGIALFLISLTSFPISGGYSSAYAQTSARWIAIVNPKRDLVVQTQQSNRYFFKVEVADTEQSRRTGLQNRLSLSNQEGMIFIFPQEQQVRMWMANTYIPLDMLFINGNGQIVHIERNTVPMSRTPLGPNQPVLAVLEVRGGLAKEMNINVGDQVQFVTGRG